ncbi:MAG: GAF domain-containing protein [Chitinophagaceae bacterium]
MKPYNEEARLNDLMSYYIMDTPREQELDEIAQIASVVCGTPVGLISFIDGERQWFKSAHGYEIDNMPRQVSFCQHTLNRPEELLVVENPLNDTRFSESPLVVYDPKVRFYAGAPLVSPDGNVLGTICVLDQQPRSLSDVQQTALQNLARQVMKFINARKLIILQKENIETNLQKLNKLTDQAPGVIFQLEMNPQGQLSFPFISKGISKLHPHLNQEAIKKDPRLAFSIIHPEDQNDIRESLKNAMLSIQPWYVEYRVVSPEGNTEWHVGKATTELGDNGNIICYGTFQNITSYKDYQNTLEKIAFDISHVLRKPVTTLLGLTAMIDTEEDIKNIDLKEYLNYIKMVSEEMENYTQQLNEVYSAKQEIFKSGKAI